MNYRIIISIINFFLLGFLLGKHVQEEYYTPMPVSKTSVNVDSLTAVHDSTESEYLGSIKRMGTANLSLIDLVGKYELALEDQKIHRPEAYMRFIRIAEFKEQYTEDIRADFINEHKRVKRQAAEAFP